MRFGWREVLIVVGLVTATVVVYGRVAHFDYVNFDDRLYAAENRYVKAGLTDKSLAWSWTTFHAGYWQPLTWMSLQLDVHLFGPGPGPMHLTNLFLHTTNVVLLFVLLGVMTGAVWRSAMVAGLFALHPLHVESVAWVTERKDVLSTLFWLLATAAYVHYARRPGLGRYLLVFTALLLGLLAKPMLVTLPCTLLLLDYWPLRRWGAGEPGPAFAPASAARLLLEKVPLFLLVAVFSVLTVITQQYGRAVMPFDILPLSVRLPHALVSYVHYLYLTFWPQGLAVLYPHSMQAPPVWQTAGAAVFLGAVTALVVWQRKRQPHLLVGWLWFLGTLFPVSGVLQAGSQALADRFTYVPHIGLFIMLVWGGAHLFERWEVRRSVVVALCGFVLAACFVCTWWQLDYWRDSISIWERTLQVTERNRVAHASLGMSLFEKKQGNRLQAIRHLNAALEIDPDYCDAHYVLGTVLNSLGRKEEAVHHLLEALRLDPNHADAHNNLGSVRGQQGQLEAAAHHFREALKGRPQAAPIYTNLGLTLYLLDRVEEAEESLQEALRLDPDDAVPHNALGVIRLRQGRLEEAVAAFRAAVERRPRLLDHDSNLAHTLRKLRRVKEAEGIYDRVRAADPPWAKSATSRAWMLATHPEAGRRHGGEALRLAQQACEVVGTPGAELLDVLAAALAEAGQFDQAAATARRALEVPELPSDQAEAIRARLRKYQEHMPYRQPLPQ